MDANERKFLLDGLSASRERLLAAVTGLEPAQTGFRAGEDGWSVCDCVEHLTIVETRVLKSIERVLQQPPEPQKAAALTGKEQLILASAPNRGVKMEAPEPVRPTRKCSDLQQLVAEFEAARDRSLQFAAGSGADLRSHFFTHIRFGDLDCYQWLVFLSAHCERHILQIEEIKAYARPANAGAA